MKSSILLPQPVELQNPTGAPAIRKRPRTGESIRQALFVIEQPGFLRLVFFLREGPGRLRLLQVDQLLTESAAVGMLRIAIASGRHATGQAEQNRKHDRGRNDESLHVGLWLFGLWLKCHYNDR